MVGHVSFCQESCQRQAEMIWSIKRRKSRNELEEIFIFYRRLLCLPMLPAAAMFWRIPAPRFPNMKYNLWLQNVLLHFLNTQEVITGYSVSLGHGNQSGGSSSISVVCKCNQSHSESLSTYCHAGGIYTIYNALWTFISATHTVLERWWGLRKHGIMLHNHGFFLWWYTIV